VLAGHLVADRREPASSTREIKVFGKGRRERIVKIDYEAARRVDRYLRVRARG
jgi:site-specific recombinase XerC